uniref:Uncharacterized protein n=1 Tax=Eutreptiella gymnastica TaxID=73025 RepID=A0A7S1N8K3_9EUGL|mmetsp:Transcript_138323/g.240485  ORF Transcript_138323/g.240485 Transcript_138323/m.240485 type:complete len:145 (+) Transcript_138323:779-1213(+)
MRLALVAWIPFGLHSKVSSALQAMLHVWCPVLQQVSLSDVAQGCVCSSVAYQYEEFKADLKGWSCNMDCVECGADCFHLCTCSTTSLAITIHISSGDSISSMMQISIYPTLRFSGPYLFLGNFLSPYTHMCMVLGANEAFEEMK